MSHETIVVLFLYLASVFIFHIGYVVFAILELKEYNYKITFHNIIVKILQDDNLVCIIITSLFPMLNTTIIVLWLVCFTLFKIEDYYEKLKEKLLEKYGKEKTIYEE
jgi:hypothetical protein